MVACARPRAAAGAPHGEARRERATRGGAWRWCCRGGRYGGRGSSGVVVVVAVIVLVVAAVVAAAVATACTCLLYERVEW
jgi:hypothetical protein